MRVAVFGTGGVGGYFGGRLAQAGEEVAFIARGTHLQAMKTQGLRVDSIKGDFYIPQVQAAEYSSQIGPVDVVLVCVKAWQMPTAAELKPLLGTDTFVVPLQNGVDAPAQLAEAIGEERVLGGLCRISAYVAGPGHIRHVAVEPYIAFGELDNRPSPRTMRLQEAFTRAKVKAEIPENITAAMWAKFIFIAAASGIGAITRAPVGAFRSIPETRQMLKHSLQEVEAIARGRLIPLSVDVVEHTIGFIDSMLPNTVASLQRDIMEGRPSELDTQIGAIVRMGKELGIATPINEMIFNSLLPQEIAARGETKDVR